MNSTLEKLLSQIYSAFSEYKIDDALEYIKKGYELLSQEDELKLKRTYELTLLLMEGKVLEFSGEWEAAFNCFEKASEVADILADKENKIKALLGQSFIYINYGKLSEADKLLDEAHIKVEKDNLTDLQPFVYLQLGGVFSKIGKHEEGEELLKKALYLAQEMPPAIETTRLISALYNQLGLLHFRAGELGNSPFYYNESINLLKNNPLELEKANAYRYLGIINSIGRSFIMAFENYRKALEIYLKLEHPFGLAKVYNSLGQAYLSINNLNEATFFFLKAGRLYTKLGTKLDLATIYSKLGHTSMVQELYQEAIDYYMKDLEISKTLDNEHGLAYTYRNLGRIYRLQGSMEESIEYYNKSLELFNKVNDIISMAYIYVDLGHSYVALGKLNQAMEYAEEAQIVFQERDRKLELAYVDLLYGACYHSIEGWEKAIGHYINAIDFLSQKEETARLAEAHYSLGLLYKDMEENRNAVNHFRQALEISERLGLKKQVEKNLQMIEEIDEQEVLRITLAKLKKATKTNRHFR